MITIEQIGKLALALPGAFEKPSYGDRPSWRTKKRMFTWVREDPEALVIWVESVEERDAMVDAEPDKFFITDHYTDHPIVLVNLGAIDEAETNELITESFRLRAEPSLVKKLD